MTGVACATLRKQPTVSVVDDDEAMRAAMTDLLDAAGCLSHAFESGEEFFASPDGTASDVVITDIQMGGMDGLTLMATLRRTIADPPPVIVVTARSDSRVKRSAIERGCHAFFSKPFDPSLLIDQVMDALSDTKARRK